ncbi:MAG TPA: alpha/beta hydrolase [Acidobacteriota bacterium]|jgi:acetyl esterase/lipase|nr:alpha/beta hydrolase [Acidobacteriota bacterium]
MKNCLRGFTFLAICALPLMAQPRVERNLIYGMYSGLALLMDVYYPEKSNGIGIVYIQGSGWHASLNYGAGSLKENPQMETLGKLNEAGYTVFTINHRAAPRFHYPAAVQDAQRAVRFIRHHAVKYRIRADRIGATGGSSGGHLVSMLGTLDGKGDAEDPDPVNRQSARVQAVVARAAPSDLMRIKTEMGWPTVTSFMGLMVIPGSAANSEEARTYREASPIYHVSSDAAPMLLIHGDADAVVPFEQSQLMEQALQKAGVAAKLLRIPGGGHGGNFPGAPNPPDYVRETILWLDRHLLKE